MRSTKIAAALTVALTLAALSPMPAAEARHKGTHATRVVVVKDIPPPPRLPDRGGKPGPVICPRPIPGVPPTCLP